MGNNSQDAVDEVAEGSGEALGKKKAVKAYGRRLGYQFTHECYYNVPGLVTEKLNITKKLKMDTAALLKSTNTEPDYSKREDVFNQLRPELTQIFR